jgi:hypothetical protein
MKETTNDGQYQKSLPTALLTAYEKTIANIPFSQDIFHELEQILMSPGKSMLPEELRIPSIAPYFEARHKLINIALLENGATQVLEIAAGFSSRGMELTNNPKFTYVEVDLAENIQLKRKVFQAMVLKQRISSRKNIFFEDGNALDFSTLETTMKHFDKSEPVAIIAEGLLRYLTLQEKAIVASNVKQLLEKRSDIWIISDADIDLNRRIEDFDLNLFTSSNDRKRFFEKLGFGVEEYQYMRIISELVSPKKLGKTDEEIERLFKNKHVYVMRA